MTAARGGTRPLKAAESGPATRATSRQGARAEGWHGARLRAAIDRLHAAQLATLAAQGGPAAPGAPALAAAALPEVEPAAPRDAYRAQHEALAPVDEIG